MKKIYLLAAAVTFAFTANAQFAEDDIESYTPGPLGAVAPYFTTWGGVSGGADDFIVSTDQAASGTQSLLIAEDQVQDGLMLLGNKISGTWTTVWNMYVPSGSVGYWNIQEDESPGIQWNADYYVGATASGGAAGVITHDQSGATIAYPSDAWFRVVQEINLDTFTFSVTIDGAPFLTDETYPGTQLGAINFFSIDAMNRYYIDDVQYVDGVLLNTNDFDAANFSVYPNPVKDVLNISSTNVVDSVVVYDVLGKVVLQDTPGVVSPSINTSALSSGAYLVNVTIDGSSKTIKVIK